MNYEWPFKVAYGDKVTCTFTNERKQSSIDVTKTPNPTSVDEPGGSVTYTVKIKNTSKVDNITLTKNRLRRRVSKNGSIIIRQPGHAGRHHEPRRLQRRVGASAGPPPVTATACR